MKVRMKKLYADAVLPSYAHQTDAGMDLFSMEEAVVRAGERALVGTGIAIELPPNTEAQIRPRSGLALKNGITLLNTPGTIDEGYRGEIKVIVMNHGAEDFLVKKGMKIAQMVIAPVLRIELEEVDCLSQAERGENGFGSTGMTAK